MGKEHKTISTEEEMARGMSERITEKPRSTGPDPGKALSVKEKNPGIDEAKSGNEAPRADLMNSMNVEEETADGEAIRVGEGPPPMYKSQDFNLCYSTKSQDFLCYWEPRE